MATSPDMAGIANLGCQLATKLVAYAIGTSELFSEISFLIEDIFATATALGELREFLATDAGAASSVYKRAGREAIQDLATRCGKVYTTIIRTIYRASLAAKVVEGVDFEALGPQDLKPSRLIAVKANMKWEMISDTVDDCRDQLRWLKPSLLLHLQVANIAHLQTTFRAPGSFDDELASRALAIRMLMRKVAATKSIVKVAERKERLALSDKSDTMSVASDAPSSNGDDSNDDTASWKSGKTAKDSTVPSIRGDKTVEKADVPPVSNPIAPPPPPHVFPTSFWHQPRNGGPDAGPVEIKLLAPKPRFPVKVFKSMGKWVKGLFRRKTTPCLDDVELEATILRHGPFYDQMAFEPNMLRRELKRILKRRSDTSSDALVPQDSQLRSAVSNALLRAQKKDGRVRQLITVDLTTQTDVAVVFMSVKPALEPIHMTDVLGRKYDLPYEMCRTVQGARMCIRDRFRDVTRLWSIVRDGAFEVVDEDDTVIIPEAWATTIKPGAVVKMRVSAFSDSGRIITHVNQGCEPLTWAEPLGGPACYRPPGMPPHMGPRNFPPPPRPMPGMSGPPPPRPPMQPFNVSAAQKAAAGYELGFEPDFGPPLTREEDLGEDRKDLGAWVALWTNATDTNFTTDSGEIPSYDDASSICSGSSSSSSEEIVD